MASSRVTARLGAGGMGEVYRARDTKLDRDVALKVLPESMAADRERLLRFEREAKTRAALNHPQIAQVYGLLEGEASGEAGPRGLRAGRSRSMRRCPSPARSPRRWKRHTTRASSTAT